MIYPLNNIKKLEIKSNSVYITYNDGTTMTINIPDWHTTERDKDGNITHKHHNQLIFQIDYKNPNDYPIIDHCI
jgi:hypothetical protein